MKITKEWSPLFSIVTCTKNSEKSLQENINSVKQQTFKDYEHVFIDGFSSDRTIKIIKPYLKKDKSRVRLYQFPAKGISNAFNMGILKGSGQWIVFLNSDDRFYDRHVLNSVHNYLLKNQGIRFVYGKSVFLIESEDGNISKRIVPHLKIYQKLRFWLMALSNDYIPHQSVFMHKDLFLKYGVFDERLKMAMDYEMWFRLLKNKIGNGFIDRKLSIYSYRKLTAVACSILLNEHYRILKKYIKNPLTLMTLETLHMLKLNLQKVLFR